MTEKPTIEFSYKNDDTITLISALSCAALKLATEEEIKSKTIKMAFKR